jgi:hypothetical protein
VLERSLAGGERILAGERQEILDCPLCENLRRAEDSTLAAIGRAFDDADVRRAYATDGAVCVAHALRLTEILPPRYLREIAEALCAHLEKGDGVRVLAGTDHDARLRSAIYNAAAEEMLAVESSALNRSLRALLEADIQEGCCPVCRAEDRAAWRYLRWMLGLGGSPGPARADHVLCARHLHDAVRIDAGRAAAVLTAMNARWVGQIERSLDRLGISPVRPLRGRRTYQEAVVAMHGRPTCRACAAADGAGRRAERLLTIALADDDLNLAYGRSHGVCLHHGLAWEGSQRGRVREVLGARLAMLVFELGESARKSDWNARFEARGAEISAWSRASTLLDGHIYCGCSATEARQRPGAPHTPPRPRRAQIDAEVAEPPWLRW